MAEREIRALSANLLEAMRFFGRARPSGEIRECPGVSVISCGLNYAAFNAAVLSSSAGPQSADLRRRIQAPAVFFESRRVRWTFWLCEHDLEPTLRKSAAAIFQSFGLTSLTDPPGLFADRLLPLTRPSPPLRIERVDNEATRLAFAHITSVGFEIPASICRDVYGNELAWKGSFEGFVGYADGLPVATTAVVVTGDVAGIYSVATLPAARCKGYAEAMMRYALARTRERTGIEATVLQSTQSGLALYQKMGYRKLTKFCVYIS